MKKAILWLVVVFSVGVAKAQQDPQYTNFMYDKLSINPGYAGMKGMYCGTILYRNQWLGLAGNPKTMLLNLDGSIPVIHGGAGITFFNDKLGLETNNIVRGAYSWHQRISGVPGVFGIGAAVGYVSKSYNGLWRPIDPDDPYIPSSAVSEGVFDLDLGIYWQHPRGHYAGISTTHLNAAAVNRLNLEMARHFWIMGGGNYPISGTPWMLQGDAIIQSDLAATQFMVAARAWYMNKFYGGLGYRHADAASVLLGYSQELPSPGNDCSKMFFTGGLSYDVTTSALNKQSNGTVELFVRFCFKPCLILTPPKPYDVRFLGT